jgi:hypothetical protein
MSEKSGVSMATLKKRMEEGKISANDVAKAFQVATSEGGLFFDMTNKQSETFAGKMSTVTDKIENLFTGLGESLNQALEPMLDGILDKLRTTKEIQSSMVKKQSDAYMGQFDLKKYLDTGDQKTLESLAERFPGGASYNQNTGELSGFDQFYFQKQQNEEKEQLEKQLKQNQYLQKDYKDALRRKQDDNVSWFNKPMDSAEDLGKSLQNLLKEEKELKAALSFDLNKAISESAIDSFNKKAGNITRQTGASFDFENDESKKKEGSKSARGKSSSNDSIGIEKIQSGTRNITLNITNLVESIVFEKGDVNGNEMQMVESVKRVLLTAVNDVNLVTQ